ncbi:hypothetical protein [Rhodococcus sp. Leaf233]|uniref:hypothetical protein n=1 Tax=Rhodococcus sp. Leaf233 TaxID=1736302 RepID=UPI0012E3691B|nr:hypothetical protein [Rhodococcus sp. Leaf233]
MDRPIPKREKRVRPPGKVLAAITFLLCAAALFGSMNYWPVAGRVFNLLNFVVFVAVALILLVVGVVWWYKTVKYLRSGQPWSRMIAVAPVIVVIGLVLALTIPEPSFERSKPKFDALVATLPATGPVFEYSISVDAFDVSVSRGLHQTEVYFIDLDTAFFSYISGWIFSPDGPPQPRSSSEELDYTSLGGPWYEFSLTFDF